MTIELHAEQAGALTSQNLIALIDSYINERSITLDQLTQSLSPQPLFALLSRMEPSQAVNLIFRPIYALYKGDDNPADHAALRLYALRILCDKLIASGVAGRELLAKLLVTYNEGNAKTALHLAAQVDYGHHIIPYLIKLSRSLGIDNYVHIADDPELGNGYCALQIAAERLNMENMRVLLEAGANPLLKSKKNQLSTYDILISKAVDQKAAKAMLLLQTPQQLKTEYGPYLDLVESKLQDTKSSSGENQLLFQVIHLKLLLNLAKSQKDLAAFAGFIKDVMKYLPQKEYIKLHDKLFQDLANAREEFTESVIHGYLQDDYTPQADVQDAKAKKKRAEPENPQATILEAAQHLMDAPGRANMALMLYEKLLSDSVSQFIKSPHEIYKLVRWCAFCIAKHHMQEEAKRWFGNAASGHKFKMAVEETDNLDDLLVVLREQADNTGMLTGIRTDVKGLLKKYQNLLAKAKEDEARIRERRENKATEVPASPILSQPSTIKPPEGAESSHISSSITTSSSVLNPLPLETDPRLAASVDSLDAKNSRVEQKSQPSVNPTQAASLRGFLSPSASLPTVGDGQQPIQTPPESGHEEPPSVETPSQNIKEEPQQQRPR